MPFTTLANGIQTSNDTLTGDAAIAINSNFIQIANNALFNLDGGPNIAPSNFQAGSVSLSQGEYSALFTFDGFGDLTINSATGNIQLQNPVVISGTLTLPVSSTSPAHSALASVAGSAATVHVDTQFAGTTGSTSYTLNDLVTVLKTAGILKA